MEGKNLEVRAECDYHHVKIMLENKKAICIKMEEKKESLNMPSRVLRFKRKIYELDGLKFNIDRVKGIGNFVEITPASMENGNGENFMKKCSSYLDLFGISEENFISQSYVEMYKKRLGIL